MADDVADDDEAQLPLLTIVGSSNHSERSIRRDVELSFGLVASERGVRSQLQVEVRKLREHARDSEEIMRDEQARASQRTVGAAFARAVAPLVRRLF